MHANKKIIISIITSIILTIILVILQIIFAFKYNLYTINNVINIFLIILSFLIIIQLIIIFKKILNNEFYEEKFETLKQTGIKIKAAIVNIELFQYGKLYNRSPYVIIAKGINPITHQVQFFHSNFIYKEILFLLKERKTVDIYIDPNNPNRYYMDVETLLNEYKNILEQDINKVFKDLIKI